MSADGHVDSDLSGDQEGDWRVEGASFLKIRRRGGNKNVKSYFNVGAVNGIHPNGQV